MEIKKLRRREINSILNSLYEKRLKYCQICREEHSISSKASKKFIKCNNIACPNKGKRVGIWKNTIFDHCHMKHYNVLRLVEAWINMYPTRIIACELRTSRQTVRNILKKLTDLLVPLYYDECESLGSQDSYVEVDESKFGKRKYNKGHPVEGVWVVGLVDKNERADPFRYIIDLIFK